MPGSGARYCRPWAWLGADVVLSLVAALGALAVAALLVLDMSARSPPRDGAAAAIGRLEASSGRARRRPARSLAWEEVRRGARLHAGDVVFVPPGSDAVVRLDDGTRLALHEGSLMVFEAPAAAGGRASAVRLAQGTVTSEAGDAGLSVRAAGALAEFGRGARANVEVARADLTRVDVMHGSASLSSQGGSQVVEARQAGVVGRRGSPELADGYPFVLVSPAANATTYFARTLPRVPLSWTGEEQRRRLVLRVSRMPSGAPVLSRRVQGCSFAYRPPAAGTYEWMLLDASTGEPLSLPARFALVEERPPLPASPSNGQVVRLAAGAPLLFSWRAVAGAQRYVLELAREADFTRVVRSSTSVEPRQLVLGDLAAGTYFWRVRVADDGRAAAPYSATVHFELRAPR